MHHNMNNLCDNEIKISVLISAYNAENYLTECLDSVFGQTLETIEVLFCNDGSTDRTSSILDRYREIHSNLIVINQENTGQGIARNRLLNMAKGQYLSFMDADDKYPSADCLEMLYERAVHNHAQICGGNIVQNENGRIIPQYSAGDGDDNHTVEAFIDNEEYNYMYGHTRYIFRTDFIRENGIKFASYRNFEDQIFTIKAIGIAGKLYESDILVYEYRINHKSYIYNECIYLDLIKGFRDSVSLMCLYNMKKMYERHCGSFLQGFLPQIVYCTHLNPSEWWEVIGEVNNLIENSGWSSDEDLITEEKMNAFIDRLHDERSKVNRILMNKRRIVLYGAGKNARKLLSDSIDWRRQVCGLAETGQPLSGSSLFDIPIKSIKDYISDKDQVQIVVTTGTTYRDSMIENCIKMGFDCYEWIDVSLLVGFAGIMEIPTQHF